MKLSLTASAIGSLLVLFTSCGDGAADDRSKSDDDSTTATTTELNTTDLKAEIQAVETAYAEAQNRGDLNTVAAFYADDAVSMPDDMPLMVGQDAIKKDLEATDAKRKGTIVVYDVLDVFGCEKYATEIGKTTRKDSTGKTVYNGKYIAVWEKRNGKWVCIRDIGNDDAKEK